MGGGGFGGRRKKFHNYFFLPKRLKKERKSQHVLTKLVSIGIGTGEDYKQKHVNASSIQNGALVGVGSLWPYFVSILCPI